MVIEDNPADVFLIREALDAARLGSGVEVIKDGEQALRWLDAAEEDDSLPRPAIVILDINLPRRSGAEVLRHLRALRRCGRARVLVVSTSDSVRDRDEMRRLGADGYFRKPSEFQKFLELGELVRGLLQDAPDA